MKKTVLVLALAALLTFAFTAAAFAHHQPSLYVEWDAAKQPLGMQTSPHEGYAKNTEKCNVCHAVHRAPVEGLRVSEQDFTHDSSTYLKGVRVGYYSDTKFGPTQMLLQTSVSNSCSFCHIATDLGGLRIYNGNVDNYSGGGWQVNAYSHAGCTNCHSVHGAYTFQGAQKPKIIKYTGTPSAMTLANGVIVGPNNWDPEHVYNNGWGAVTVNIQDEVFMSGDATATYTATDDKVDSNNKAMFSTLADTINGVPVAALSGDAANAQTSALCTICHANYSSASEQIVNPDGDIALFTNGYWDFTTVYNTYGTPLIYKNHPVGPAAMNITAFSAAGDTTPKTQVSWATAGTCRSCHDAGVTNAAVGVIEQSWPHFTPGQWMFVAAGDGITAPDVDPDYAADNASFELLTPSMIDGGAPEAFEGGDFAFGAEDGQCIKCHNNAAGGVGKTF